MKRAIPMLFAIVLAASGTVRAQSADWEVKLAVDESAGLARTSEPVSGGIPLPRGLVKDPAAVRLLDAGGKEVPAQFSAINRWADDGSVMWLLVQSTATVPAKGQVVYTLKPGAAAAAARRGLLRVEDGADAVTVETGRIRFLVSKRKFNLLDGAWFDADGDGKYAPAEQVVASDPRGGSALTVKNGEVYASGASAPKEVVVEESGPERVVIAVRGLHAAEGGKGALPWCYGYVVRIRAWAGEPFVRISYCFTDENLPPIGSPEMKDAVVGIPLKLSGEVSAALGGKDKVSGALAEGKSVGLLCAGEGKGYGVKMVEAKLLGMEGAAPAGELGWAAASAGNVGAALSVRDLRENWPAVLAVRREKELAWLELKPWPAEVEAERCLDVCSRKTYELQLTLGKAGAGGVVDSAPALFAAQNDALRFWPSAEWTLATRAWGDFGGLAMLDDAARKALDREKGFGNTGWRMWGATPDMESGSSSAPDGGYEPLLKDSVFYNGYMQTG